MVCFSLCAGSLKQLEDVQWEEPRGGWLRRLHHEERLGDQNARVWTEDKAGGGTDTEECSALVREYMCIRVLFVCLFYFIYESFAETIFVSYLSLEHSKLYLLTVLKYKSVTKLTVLISQNISYFW